MIKYFCDICSVEIVEQSSKGAGNCITSHEGGKYLRKVDGSGGTHLKLWKGYNFEIDKKCNGDNYCGRCFWQGVMEYAEYRLMKFANPKDAEK